MKKNEGKKNYIGGGEESYGFLCEDFVRDKDAVSACAILAEIAAWAKDQGITMYQLLQNIYVQYGFSKEKGISVVKKGKSGAEVERQRGGDCMKFDAFMNYGYTFDKWVIVGHWPVMLYLADHVCANPIIDREHRVISIDGGCSLKDDGQLNALIIPYEGSENFSFEAYDPFPVRRVKSAQCGGGKSYYIRWGDNDVQVLRRGEEFSLVRHVRTGYEMEILTKYLYSDEEFCKCNDSTDLVLSLEAGDEVSVVEETSRGYLVKHKGTSGWYWGELI